jgi:hypothetical protein
MDKDDDKGDDGGTPAYMGDICTSEDSGGQKEVDEEIGSSDEEEEGDESDCGRFQFRDEHGIG